MKPLTVYDNRKPVRLLRFARPQLHPDGIRVIFGLHEEVDVTPHPE